MESNFERGSLENNYIEYLGPEHMINKGDVEVSAIGKHGLVYGEAHTYTVDISKLEDWDKVIDEAQSRKIIVEFPSQKEESEPITSYMQLAESVGKKGGRGVEILDSTQNPRDLRCKKEIFYTHGYEHTIEEIAAMQATFYSLVFIAEEEYKSISLNEGISKISEHISNKCGADSNKVCEITTNIIENRKFDDIIEYDSIVREQIMQDNLSGILSRMDSEEDFMVVVGKEHIEGIMRTCEDKHYRTEMSEELKERVSTSLRIG